MKGGLKTMALLCSVILAGAGGATSSALAGGTVTVPGWPAYIAMGAIGGPDGGTLSCSTAAGTGEDDFQGAPLDAIFSYAGTNGNGDPGIIDPPYKALAMTNELATLSACPNNQHGTRAALVEYIAQMSGSVNTSDFADTGSPNGPDNITNPTPDYVMARHFITLAADASAFNGPRLSGTGPNSYGGPFTYNGASYYGTLILNPDMMGTIEQHGQSAVDTVNSALPAGAVNTAVDITLCVMTTSRSYTSTNNKTYTGTPVHILEQMLADGYSLSSINGTSDPYWPLSIDNITIAYPPPNYTAAYSVSKVGSWLYSCAGSPTYDKTTYQVPTFPAGLDGWVQANNWLIRTFSPKGNVTFGWHENMYAGTGSDFWLQSPLTSAQVNSTYSTPVENFLQANAPSVISSSAPLGTAYVPDYFVFDRYGTDDSTAADYANGATLYNAQSWDNYLEAVGQISTHFSNIPIMMWQIPAAHISNSTEATPEYFNNTQGDGYIFGTAPDYFFGDSNLTSNLSNISNLPNISASSTSPTTSVGLFELGQTSPYCGPNYYNPCSSSTTYQSWLLTYQGQANNYDWSKDNGKLAKATANNVFAILWGCGGCTNVVQNVANDCQCDDHGWLKDKIIDYYKNPTPLTPDIAHAHDFNGDSNVSDILWRDGSGNLAVWLMSGGKLSSGANISQVSTAWTVAASHDFNRDGSSDILWLDNAGNLGVWTMNGTAVTSRVEIGNVGTQWSVAGTGDFNGDRNGDILWRNTQTGETAIWLMNGDGNFSSGVDFGTVPLAWTVAGTGDFNGDGTTDILWRNTQTGDLAIWLMKNGQLSSGLDLGDVSNIWSVVGTGDFNGDGTSDILWRDTSGNLAIWIMGNGKMTSGSTLAQVAKSWSVSETGDFDGDGKSDILWSDTAGDLGVWLMNGLSVSSQIGLGNVGTSWQPQGKNSD